MKISHKFLLAFIIYGTGVFFTYGYAYKESLKAGKSKSGADLDAYFASFFWPAYWVPEASLHFYKVK